MGALALNLVTRMVTQLLSLALLRKLKLLSALTQSPQVPLGRLVPNPRTTVTLPLRPSTASVFPGNGPGLSAPHRLTTIPLIRTRI